MEEMIKITAEKVINSLDGFGLIDMAYILDGIAEKLKEKSGKCMMEEYLMDEI